MGTPLVDALADYRDQLAPAAADGARPRRWRWWLLLGMVGLILVGGAATLLRPGDSPTPSAASPVAGPADPDPATGPTTSPPAGDPTLAGLDVLPATQWEPWSTPIIGTWLPRIPGAGPVNPPGSGFTRTPTGALAAAATLYPLAYYSHPESAWTPIADTRVVWAPGQRDELAAALAPVWAASLPTPVVVTPIGYRAISYSPDQAQVRLWWELTYPDGEKVTIGSLVAVLWVDGDWSLYFDEPAMDSRGLEPSDTYLIWGPT